MRETSQTLHGPLPQTSESAGGILRSRLCTTIPYDAIVKCKILLLRSSWRKRVPSSVVEKPSNGNASQPSSLQAQKLFLMFRHHTCMPQTPSCQAKRQTMAADFQGH